MVYENTKRKKQINLRIDISINIKFYATSCNPQEITEHK